MSALLHLELINDTGQASYKYLILTYQVIEALAFEEEPPEFREKDDLTLPDNEGILQEAREELIAFRVSSLQCSQLCQ